MPLHRAEIILVNFAQQLRDSAFVTVVDSSIVRDRVDPANATPDINIKMGVDDVDEEDNMVFIDSTLNIILTISVKNSTGLSTELNEIRKQIHQAIYANPQLNLNFVITAKYTGTNEISVSGDAENETAQQNIKYSVWYRHAIADPSA